MAPLQHFIQVLRGRHDIYTVGKQLQDTVYLASNPFQKPGTQKVILKKVNNLRLLNERDVLQFFARRTALMRLLIDEVLEPSNPPAIVLRYLDDNILNASVKKQLTKKQVKYVARRVLEALKVLHQDNFVHTNIKPDNILVNYGTDDTRFTEVQLADFGSTAPAKSAHAKDSDMIGAPIWRSPEAHLQIGWGTPADIWSLGPWYLITLLYGGDFSLFRPDVPVDHEEYELEILTRQCEWFRPFPPTYRELCPDETLRLVEEDVFLRISKELSKDDKGFILKIRKLDPRDRLSAAELLQDNWFDEANV
ncbi:serine/threonine protein kinase [Aspergillus heterothallicus]